jgi:type VI secretion system protein ImpK
MPSPLAADPRATYPALSHFFEFWEEVEALRREVRHGAQAETPAPVPARRRELLAEMLRGQRPSAGRPDASGGLSRLDEAQYAMVATADELFIDLDWDGADSWRMRPLEMELFGTRRAGQEIFARIDRILDGFSGIDTEMAAVYLTALELGFKGKFADDADRPTLDSYESALRKLVGRLPRTAGPLVPQCYDYTLVAGSGPRLPASRMWWSAAAAIVGLFLAVLVIVSFTRFRGNAIIEDARQRLETSFGDLAARP